MELDPKLVVWELTLKCNSRCYHCGSDAKMPREDELSTGEAFDLIEDISDIGFERVILSGGEPTLRMDWSVISERIQEKGMDLGIISNSLSWNHGVIDTLVGLNPYSIGFSVDGERELHDELRGIRGSHEKVFRSIAALKERDQYICAITSVNKRNLSELEKIRDKLVLFGVDAWQVQLAFPMGRMDGSLVLNDEEYSSLVEFLSISDYDDLIKIALGDCIGYFGDFAGCWGGIKGIGIDSDGTVRGCLSMRRDSAVEGNIREKSLKDIWEGDSFLYNRNFSVNDLGELCSDCGYGESCKGGCNANSLAHFDRFNNSPYCFLRTEVEKNG